MKWFPFESHHQPSTTYPLSVLNRNPYRPSPWVFLCLHPAKSYTTNRRSQVPVLVACGHQWALVTSTSSAAGTFHDVYNTTFPSAALHYASKWNTWASRGIVTLQCFTDWTRLIQGYPVFHTSRLCAKYLDTAVCMSDSKEATHTHTQHCPLWECYNTPTAKWRT